MRHDHGRSQACGPPKSLHVACKRSRRQNNMHAMQWQQLSDAGYMSDKAFRRRSQVCNLKSKLCQQQIKTCNVTASRGLVDGQCKAVARASDSTLSCDDIPRLNEMKTIREKGGASKHPPKRLFQGILRIHQSPKYIHLGSRSAPRRRAIRSGRRGSAYFQPRVDMCVHGRASKCRLVHL